MTNHLPSDYEAFEKASIEQRRLLRQEELILEVTEAISGALRDLSVSQTELAERLGKSKSFVSQILGGDRNLTLRTLSDVVDALECCIRVDILPEAEAVEGSLDWPSERHQVELSLVECANENERWSKAA